jgi:hypothetical protein
MEDVKTKLKHSRSQHKRWSEWSVWGSRDFISSDFFLFYSTVFFSCCSYFPTLHVTYYRMARDYEWYIWENMALSQPISINIPAFRWSAWITPRNSRLGKQTCWPRFKPGTSRLQINTAIHYTVKLSSNSIQYSKQKIPLPTSGLEHRQTWHILIRFVSCFASVFLR